jgi:CDP-glucose 4,6-dehydratase
LEYWQGAVEAVVMSVPTPFWQGKRVLLTGHTGFKGSWLSIWLQRLGAQVTGVSLAPADPTNLFALAGVADGMDSRICDIRDGVALTQIVRDTKPEIVLHLAAQALVRSSYYDPLATYATNVMGTAHLLDALRGLDSVRAAVMVTTDKVYRNREWTYPYREDDALGGHDPYSASKAASEIVIASYRDAFLAAQGVAVASARAGNVVGGGDWSVDRLIPDAVRAWQGNAILEIRRPGAIRPWQHVLSSLSAYLTLAEQLWSQPTLAGAYNFGPCTHEAATVRRVVELAREAYGSGAVRFDDSGEGLHEAGLLALEIAKARSVLNVHPQWGLSETVRRTMAWYRAQHDGANARTLCETDIAEYEGRP